MIDYTLLRSDAIGREIDTLCATAGRYRFAAVCVNPCWVSRAVSRLSDTDVKVVTVVGFPLGTSVTDVKAFETRQAVDAGAQELDVVAPIGHVKEENWSYVLDDISAVVEAASGRKVKVILETAVLNAELIVKAALICKDAGAHFVKTSTGFSEKGGATVAAVQLLRRAVGPDMGVKASGGIRDARSAWQMIEAGADRIGTSSLIVDSAEAHMR